MTRLHKVAEPSQPVFLTNGLATRTLAGLFA